MRLCFVIAAFFLTELVQALEPLRTIREVKALGVEEIAQKRPVLLQGQMMKMGAQRHGVFLHDGKEGIYVSFRERSLTQLKYRQGDLLEIKGVTNPGNIFPHIDAQQIKIIDHQPLPEPIQLTRANLYDAEFDCQWVEVEGIVVTEVTTGFVQSLRLRTLGDALSIVMPYSIENNKWAQKQVNRVVKVRGALGTRFNDQRQMTGRSIQIHSPADVTYIGGRSERLPLVPINKLVKFNEGVLEEVRVRGIVTYLGEMSLSIQDEDSNLLIRTNEKGEWKVGDEIEVRGTVSIEPFRPAFYGQSITVIGPGKELEPMAFFLEEDTFPESWHYNFVELKVTLIESQVGEDRFVLNCSTGKQLFKAYLPGSMALDLEPGSMLRLRGICVLSSSEWQAHVFQPDGFILNLRDHRDITILSEPSWWNVQRTVYVLGVLGASFLIVGFWAWLLKRKVTEQTSVIAAQVEREAVTNERQRLARELHDSFEQNMSGLAIQLQSVEQKVQQGENAVSSLDLAKRILERSMQESRESIHDLRRSPQGAIASEWHDSFLLSRAEALDAKIEVHSEGEFTPLDRTVEWHILKIVREASSNGLKHGGAKLVKICFINTLEEMTVSIEDNGLGFDASAPPSQGHFGILGMEERAKRIHGHLTIASEIDRGTTVTLTVPKQS